MIKLRLYWIDKDTMGTESESEPGQYFRDFERGYKFEREEIRMAIDSGYWFKNKLTDSAINALKKFLKGR